MELQEFSNEFDILYNNIMSNQAPGLNEYEKSVFLTLSQESVVKDLYNGNFNGTSFDGDEELKRYLSPLIKDAKIKTYSEGTKIFLNKFKLPDDLLFLIHEDSYIETIIIEKGEQKNLSKTIPVIPTNYDNLHKTLKNPFRKDSDNRVLRLDAGNSLVELISKYPISEYRIKYLSKPAPIILVNLEEYYPNLSINGESEARGCSLDSNIHREILNRAVALAKQNYAV